jgi:cysteine desulfurase
MIFLNVIYLDNSATTKPHPDVVAAVVDVMENNYGNPSSLHTMGVAAERIIKKARERVARSLKASLDEIYFTSGGTEGNNLVLAGAYNALRVKGDIITTKTEHKSVLETLQNFDRIKYVKVDKYGVIDVDELGAQITEKTSMVSIAHVNNEIGAIQPIEQIAGIIKRKNPACLFHVDAVQSYRKIAIPKNTADLVTVSGHKIHGPKGVGALYIKKGVRIKPLVYGGGQEREIRSGTEDTAAISGFGVAAELQFDMEYIKKLNDTLRAKLKNVIINSRGGSAYIINISVPGIRSEILLHSLEQRGVIVSSGSACSSNRPSPSHVLTAMGLPGELIDSSIRISLSMMNTEREMHAAGDIINDVVRLLKTQLGSV